MTSTETTIEAHFEITSSDEEVYDEPGEGPKLTQITMHKRYHGTIEGTSVTRVLTAQGAGGQGYLASERVVGAMDGREGSFVIQHGGIAEAGGQRTFGQIVPGSGTGDLAGSAGRAIEAQHAVLTLVFEAG